MGKEVGGGSGRGSGQGVLEMRLWKLNETLSGFGEDCFM